MASSIIKIKKLMASVLILYLAISTIFVWTLDLLRNQSMFGLTISSQFSAFSMLLYLYLTADTDEISSVRILLGLGFIIFLLFMTAFIG